MSTKIGGLGAAVAVLSAGAALVPADPAGAHYPVAPSPAGVGSAGVAHDGGDHAYVSICTHGHDDVSAWFWLDNGAPFVATNQQYDVCYAWDVPASVVYFYPCDYKGCGPATFV